LIVTLLGGLLGTGLGLVLGAAGAASITASSAATGVTVPFATIGEYAVIAVLAGLLAAIAPARRAARVEILSAIAVE
jgi:putative ABC transport system permease protein